MYYVYILKCSDNTLYTGITNNLTRRLSQHNKGVASKYTRTRLPVKYVYQMEMETKSDALREELRIKSLTRKQKEQFILKASEQKKSASKNQRIL